MEATAQDAAKPVQNAEPPITAAPILATLRQGHPRLVATPGIWAELKTRRAADATLDSFLKRGEAEARAILAVPPSFYEKQGRRLLAVSRTVLRRVLLLAQQFHFTGDAALARRAQQEMLAAAAFPDWNPSHFLDTGEMTAALALGYDWLYDQIDAPTRQIIATAIIEKGLRPSLDNQGWASTQNNWNQVCLSGMSLGALALAENEPVLAAQMLERTKNFNANGLKPYAPDGVYPEGAMYWGYGTSFQTLLLGALQSALGTDWGLSRSPGFLQSADSLLQQLGPSNTYFNFFDGVERIGLESPWFWYARTLNRPDLLRSEMATVKEYANSPQPPRPEGQHDRLLPLAALWWPTTPIPTDTPQPLNWYGRSPNPLAVFRSAWNDPKAMYLAAKGGKASLSHGHMDAGSFVFEAGGVRWARDLGMQDYYSLESKGIGLWSGAQDGGRWTIFRLNNFSHNTLTINHQLHRVDGQASITHFSATDEAAGAILDLTPVFKGQAGSAKRGFAFRKGSHALIRDEIEGLQAGDTVRWALLTAAEVRIGETGTEAILTQSGQTLRVQLLPSVEAKFEIISADPPHPEYDAPNPGHRFLIVNLKAPAAGKIHLSVSLQLITGPQATRVEDQLAQTELSQWPLARTV